MLRGGAGVAVRDDRNRPWGPGVLRTRRPAHEDLPPENALAGPPSRSVRPSWSLPDPRQPSPRVLAAQVVQICHKDPDRAGALEENR